MDDSMREGFAALSAQLSGVADDAREAASRSRETAAQVAVLTATVDIVGKKVDRLEREVFGSTPPPPLPPPIPVLRRVSENEGDLAELEGRLMAVQTELAAVKQINEEQSKKLGLEANGFWGIVRNATAKDVIKLATLLAAAYAAFHQAIH